MSAYLVKPETLDTITEEADTMDHDARRKAAPELPAHIGFRGNLNVWCDFCGENHSHQPPYGHREAHCRSPESPYYDSGYTLVPAPKEGT